MKHWTIGKRISFGFAGILLIPILLGVFAYLRFSNIQSQSERIVNRLSAARNLCEGVKLNVEKGLHWTFQHVATDDSTEKLRLEKSMAENSVDTSKAFDGLKGLMETGRGKELMENVVDVRKDYGKLREEVLVASRQASNNIAAYHLAKLRFEPLSEQYKSRLESLAAYCSVEQEQAMKDIRTSVHESQVWIITALSLACLIGGFLAFAIIRNTKTHLRRIADALDANASEVSSAASQVAAASQSVAEGASQQAASLEETSSSLEEMSSMTQRNTGDAANANSLTHETRAAAEVGAREMQSMSQAMSEIQTSADDIAKIIKHIDEIAFQTNILALNAAVEAARAGEAGMGFAVVAGEVRNLAQRAAQSSRETEDKIEKAISKTTQGAVICSRVSQSLKDILSKVAQVDDLAAGVASASREQAQGVAQINTAISEMDKSTQNNAAYAEEAASASAELQSQSESLKARVAELLELIDGGSRSTPQAWSEPLQASSSSRNLIQVPERRQAASQDIQTSNLLPMDDAEEELISWNESKMSTGVPRVDSEHRELISMVNRLHVACLKGTGRAELGAMIAFLGKYVQNHFSHEEKEMERLNCSSKEANKVAHRQFLNEFGKLAAEFEAKGESTAVLLGLKGLVASWLTNHICKIDTKLRDCR